MSDSTEITTIRITVRMALTGEIVGEVDVPSNHDLDTLRQTITEKVGELGPYRMFHDGEVLLGIKTLADTNIADGSCVDLVRGGIPGWTRLCHGDTVAKETTGSPLIWDLPLEKVMSLAAKATRVRIQAKSDTEVAVVSKPDAYPIENLRKGNPIGYMRGLRKEEVADHWESEKSDMLPGRLWHTSFHWHRENHDKLELKVYHSCDNGGGIHWAADHCGWGVASADDLELYIDACEGS
eukprot:gnl/MRDRNA2_/MRDRNA2_71534_c0_seq2.p1 gnl/MRDRNA2_/MRDRNA2_71534_c0~~gnl/MRDRNA2_/MRDRNA2_71534_c0_seq2.p1  ORF type:complete len:238 (-),score=36.07 gnl/MRDRNA2_/MRDRNA2_71534_c0_seq2:96-809(-)